MQTEFRRHRPDSAALHAQPHDVTRGLSGHRQRHDRCGAGLIVSGVDQPSPPVHRCPGRAQRHHGTRQREGHGGQITQPGVELPPVTGIAHRDPVRAVGDAQQVGGLPEPRSRQRAGERVVQFPDHVRCGDRRGLEPDDRRPASGLHAAAGGTGRHRDEHRPAGRPGGHQERPESGVIDHGRAGQRPAACSRCRGDPAADRQCLQSGRGRACRAPHIGRHRVGPVGVSACRAAEFLADEHSGRQAEVEAAGGGGTFEVGRAQLVEHRPRGSGSSVGHRRTVHAGPHRDTGEGRTQRLAQLDDERIGGQVHVSASPVRWSRTRRP